MLREKEFSSLIFAKQFDLLHLKYLWKTSKNLASAEASEQSNVEQVKMSVHVKGTHSRREHVASALLFTRKLLLCKQNEAIRVERAIYQHLDIESDKSLLESSIFRSSVA